LKTLQITLLALSKPYKLLRSLSQNPTNYFARSLKTLQIPPANNGKLSAAAPITGEEEEEEDERDVCSVYVCKEEKKMSLSGPASGNNKMKRTFFTVSTYRGENNRWINRRSNKDIIGREGQLFIIPAARNMCISSFSKIIVMMMNSNQIIVYRCHHGEGRLLKSFLLSLSLSSSATSERWNFLCVI
jgi:hypothetical protein